MKKCTCCLEEKSLEEFHKLKLGKLGLNPVCNSCRVIKQKEHRTQNNAARIKYLYGMEKQDFDRLLEQQQNRCAICNNSFLSKRNTVIDHCHVSGKVRGLLCRTCNVGIGQLKDDPEIVQKALEYLRAFEV